MRFPLPAALLALLLLPACTGSSSYSHPDRDSSDPLAVKRAMVALVRDRYLWPETVPAQVQVEDYDTPLELLDHLTAEARRQGKDRSWSCIQPLDDLGSGLRQGALPDRAVLFGAGIVARNGRYFIREVLPGSEAARAGVARGDECLAVSASRAGLDDPGNQVPALAAAGRLNPSLAFGYLRLRQGGSGALRDVPIVTSEVSLDLVPEAEQPVVLEAEGGRRVGYLQLRGFRIVAEDLLRKACAHLRRQGATDLIVDLRYNGGGTVRTAAVFANLLRADQGPADVMTRIQFNANRPEEVSWFSAEPEALRLGRIAFIVTGNSASASEMLVNALLPYFRGNLALVGSRTHGKPVGMEPLPVPGARTWGVLLVTLHVRNAAGVGDYFQGLPDRHFAGSSCAAEDDLRHAPGDPAEASTAAALRWIVDGTSALGPIQPAPAAARLATGVPAGPDSGSWPRTQGPVHDLPGLF